MVSSGAKHILRIDQAHGRGVHTKPHAKRFTADRFPLQEQSGSPEDRPRGSGISFANIRKQAGRSGLADANFEPVDLDASGAAFAKSAENEIFDVNKVVSEMIAGTKLVDHEGIALALTDSKQVLKSIDLTRSQILIGVLDRHARGIEDFQAIPQEYISILADNIPALVAIWKTWSRNYQPSQNATIRDGLQQLILKKSAEMTRTEDRLDKLVQRELGVVALSPEQLKLSSRMKFTETAWAALSPVQELNLDSNDFGANSVILNELSQSFEDSELEMADEGFVSALIETVLAETKLEPKLDDYLGEGIEIRPWTQARVDDCIMRLNLCAEQGSLSNLVYSKSGTLAAMRQILLRMLEQDCSKTELAQVLWSLRSIAKEH